MKTVFFMRHAKSDWSFDLSDIKRPLNDRGKSAAPRIGGVLKERKDTPQLFLSSPAVRAVTTAKLVAKSSGFSGEVVVKDNFYFGNMFDVIDDIKGLPMAVDKVIVFGHNPTWENLVSHFVPHFNISKFPTAAVAKINFSVSVWEDIDSKISDLEWFIKPSDFV